MNIKQQFLLLLIAAFIPISACASINSPIDGIVIDESTGQPIPGAFVIAQWVRYGSDGVGSRTSCPHVEVVQSDDKGRYRIPAVSVGGLGVNRLVFPYKAGYARVFKGQEPDDQLITMRPFAGTGDERKLSFATFGSLRACASASESLKKLGLLYQAIDAESRSLTLTRQQPQPPLGFFDLLQEDMQTEQIAKNRK